MPNLYNIAIIMRADLAWVRGILRGVAQFACPNQPWILHVLHEVPTMGKLRRFRRHNLHGAICYLQYRRQIDEVLRWKIPWINIAGQLHEPRCLRVGADDQAVGRMAAEYFLTRGFRHLAFLGNPASHYSRQRGEGFRQVIAGAGLKVYTPPPRMRSPWGWSVDHPLLRRWLVGLPRPLGVFCYADAIARLAASVCRVAGLSVPEEVALLGVSNDDVMAEMSYPPLSSIQLPLEGMGYRAGEILADMLAGKAAPTGDVEFPPVGVITRRSSAVVAIDDPEVAAALRIIHGQADEPLTVSEILRQVPINRRALERRFRAHVGRSLHDEIRRAHVDRAKKLLINTSLAIDDVAARAGFGSATRLGIVFRQVVGMTPREFRRSGLRP